MIFLGHLSADELRSPVPRHQGFDEFERVVYQQLAESMTKSPQQVRLETMHPLRVDKALIVSCSQAHQGAIKQALKNYEQGGGTLYEEAWLSGDEMLDKYAKAHGHNCWEIAWLTRVSSKIEQSVSHSSSSTKRSPVHVTLICIRGTLQPVTTADRDQTDSATDWEASEIGKILGELKKNVVEKTGVNCILPQAVMLQEDLLALLSLPSHL